MSAIEQFREQTRSWLEANCPPSQRKAIPEGELVWGGRDVEYPSADAQLWFERMRDKGWFCPDWPQAYGGGGLSPEYNVEKAARLSEVIAAYLYGGEHGAQGPRKTAVKQRKAVHKKQSL